MKRLKEWRRERQMTASQLAEAAGISESTLSELENGRHLPQYRTMRAICRVLDLDPLVIEEFAEAIAIRQSLPWQR